MQLLFNIAASGLICFDTFVLVPQPKLSLLGDRDDVKPKFRLTPLMCVGFALLFAGCIYLSHVRIAAVLTMSALCLLLLDRYRKTNSFSASK
jgi:hypothetical protein